MMTVVDVASDHEIACLSSDGYLLVFAANEIKKLSGGGRGVTLLDLARRRAAGQCALPIGVKGLVVVGSGRSGKEQRVRMTSAALEHHRGRRGRKGRKLGGSLKSMTLVRPEREPSTGAREDREGAT